VKTRPTGIAHARIRSPVITPSVKADFTPRPRANTTWLLRWVAATGASSANSVVSEFAAKPLAGSGLPLGNERTASDAHTRRVNATSVHADALMRASAC